MSSPSVLITGAGGYVGQRLARRCISENVPVCLWLHAHSEQEFETKRERLLDELGLPSGSEALPKLKFAWGELQAKDPFVNVDSDPIGTIVHSAAVTQFNVDKDLANAVNFEGTQKLAIFARACPNLTKFCHLSTLYAAGLATDTVLEEPLSADREFANHYEWSKWQAERLLLEEFSELPWVVLRLATIISDDDTGQVTQQNAVHNTLKLLFYGLLSLLPGDKEAPVYLITGDFAVDAVWAAIHAHGDARHAHYNVCHQAEHCLTLEQLATVAYEQFQKDNDFRSRKILKPLFCDVESFDLLAETAGTMKDSFMGQSVSSVQPFARQLFAPKRFDNRSLVATLPGYEAPDPSRVFRNACDALVTSRWGRRQGVKHAQ